MEQLMMVSVSTCCKSAGLIGLCYAIPHWKHCETVHAPAWSGQSLPDQLEVNSKEMTSIRHFLQRFARIAARFSSVCHRLATVQTEKRKSRAFVPCQGV